MSSIEPTITYGAVPIRPYRWGRIAIIWGLWLWLYWPVFDYLSLIFSREDFRTNQILLIGIVALIASRVWQARDWGSWSLSPRLAVVPLMLALGGSAAYLAAERFWDVNMLSATLFGLASYGLLGLWVPAARWWRGLPAILLLIGTLPFGDHMQTFVGYPMRILTAAIVRDGLAAAGVASVGVDTILIFENGVSHIDLPCSGVKSLWTGTLFLLAATWIEGRPLNSRWLLITAVSGLLFFVVNIIRVGVLVTVGEVMGWHLAAEMLHVPLGVMGFAAVCALAVGLLRRQRPLAPVVVREQDEKRPLWLSPFLAVAILGMALLYTPRPENGLTQAAPAWNFPAELAVEPLPLKPDEYAWLTRDGADSADRHRFEWRGLSGSMILISSHTWRAHHRPERCFEVYGLSIDESRTHLVDAELPVRLVSLGDGDGRYLHTASYWFQSMEQTTDDYATRIWADLAPEREQWVLVSVLFDEVHDPNDGDVQALYTALHQAVGAQLIN